MLRPVGLALRAAKPLSVLTFLMAIWPVPPRRPLLDSDIAATPTEDWPDEVLLLLLLIGISCFLIPRQGFTAKLRPIECGYALEDRVCIDRFNEMNIESGLRRPVLILFITPTCHCDKHNVLAPRLLANTPCGLVTIQFRHADIENNHVRPKLLRSFESFKTVERCLDFVSEH